MSANKKDIIPPTRPKLPTAEALLPYLKQIDENRYYTNFGPLVHTFEQRFADWIGVRPDQLVTTSTGTAALEVALAAYDLPEEHYVIMPSWTFIATAHAVLSAKLKPFFVDVDPVSWAITPSIVEQALHRCAGPVALIMVVAPFGLPPDIQGWEAFTDKTGIPVVIDGAALAPPDIVPSDKITLMTSLHATKIFSAGEGGMIIRKDPAFIQRAKELSNFDLTTSGVKQHTGNKKLSEYHAAIGQACMDEWDDIAADFMRVAKRYHQNLQGQSAVKLRPGYGTEFMNSVCVVELNAPVDAAKLEAVGIGSRMSWRHGCHKEPLLADAPCTDLSVTEHISHHCTAIPCWRDLPDADIDFICERLLA